MRNPIILFPKKPILGRQVLAKMSNKEAALYKRYTLILKFDAEDINKAYLHVAACSPHDRFERKTGRTIAETKTPYTLVKEDFSDWKNIVNFLEYVASSGAPLEKILEAEKDENGIVNLVQTPIT